MRSIAIVAVASLLACGGDEASSTSGAGGSAASSSSSAGGGSAQTPAVFLSFIAEQGPGNAPAWLGFDNATPHILTLQLGGANFWQLAMGDPAPAQLSASVDAATDMRLGYHESKSEQAPCIFLDLFSVTGAMQLDPGKAYIARLTGSDVEQLVVDIQATADPSPYSALRARTLLPGFGAELSVGVAGEAAPFSWPVTQGADFEYRHVDGATITLEQLAYTAPGGERYALSLDVTLGDAFGYTAVVDIQAQPDAVEAFELERQP